MTRVPARSGAGTQTDRHSPSAPRGGNQARPAPFDSGLVVEAPARWICPGMPERSSCRTRRRDSWRFHISGRERRARCVRGARRKAIRLGRRARLVVAVNATVGGEAASENLAQAGSGREFAVVADAANPCVRPMDAVLLDAPCLGTGSFARHPTQDGVSPPRRSGPWSRPRPGSWLASRRRCGRGPVGYATVRSSRKRTRTRCSGSWRSIRPFGGTCRQPYPRSA
jgi:hypothetical protein